jgi:hypothetical protein
MKGPSLVSSPATEQEIAEQLLVKNGSPRNHLFNPSRDSRKAGVLAGSLLSPVLPILALLILTGMVYTQLRLTIPRNPHLTVGKLGSG